MQAFIFIHKTICYTIDFHLSSARFDRFLQNEKMAPNQCKNFFRLTQNYRTFQPIVVVGQGNCGALFQGKEEWKSLNPRRCCGRRLTIAVKCIVKTFLRAKKKSLLFFPVLNDIPHACAGGQLRGTISVPSRKPSGVARNFWTDPAIELQIAISGVRLCRSFWRSFVPKSNKIEINRSKNYIEKAKRPGGEAEMNRAKIRASTTGSRGLGV